ncbi:UNVERIFIED_CONTAM: Microtubule-associated protein 70-5 [Sesamum radiatum]|uniref:Microtubule-associated protein 70-5 n=1 Tax=Sesamum radiatum TaxID=300843 RepID=A0AAW2T2W3_SESRA
MPGFEELGGEDVSLVSHPDPVVLELNRLQNQLKEKERELGKAQSEIRALRATEVLKDKALEELGSEVRRLEGKLRSSENHIEQKLKKIYANQKDDDSVPIELVIAPLEAELKMHKNEIAALQEDKRALERLTKSKEAALLEAERILRSALERALIVEEVQIKTSSLGDKLRYARRRRGRWKGTSKSRFQQIATVVANEWKDEKDKVMPVKQWLEERRMLQAEMQKLKDKLAISERAAKAEAQVKFQEKLKLRLKTLEEGLKHVNSLSINTNGSPKNEKSNNFFGILSTNTRMKKRSTSQPRPSTITRSSMQMMDEKQISSATAEIKPINNLKKKNSCGESLLKKSLWASRNKVIQKQMNKNAMVDDEMGKREAPERSHKFEEVLRLERQYSSEDLKMKRSR